MAFELEDTLANINIHNLNEINPMNNFGKPIVDPTKTITRSDKLIDIIISILMYINPITFEIFKWTLTCLRRVCHPLQRCPYWVFTFGIDEQRIYGAPKPKYKGSEID